MGGGDPARSRKDYYPAWLDNLAANDVTGEGTAWDGAIQGAACPSALSSWLRATSPARFET